MLVLISFLGVVFGKTGWGDRLDSYECKHSGPALRSDLVGACALELGDGLGALGDSVLRELAGEHEADRSLDLSRGEGLLLAVAAELGRLESDALEDVIDEGVHDRHALLGDTRVGVDLCAEA